MTQIYKLLLNGLPLQDFSTLDKIAPQPQE
jgi:hypothetical protein